MSRQTMNNVIADYFKTQPVVRAWLFGSFARGEETPLSDVDLIVQYDDKARISLLKHCAIMNDLEELLDRKVDLVEDGELLPFAVESANHDKKLIYERVLPLAWYGPPYLSTIVNRSIDYSQQIYRL